MSDRALFCAVLSNYPLIQADAIVVLAGEDAPARAVQAALLSARMGVKSIYITGGVSKPPEVRDAREVKDIMTSLFPMDVPIDVDTLAKNTAEQGASASLWAKHKGFDSVLLVASGYHIVRAFLTFLKNLQEDGLTETIRLIPAPTRSSPWFDGHVDKLRAELVNVEIYKAKGHVATYKEGLDYLKYWEAQNG